MTIETSVRRFDFQRGGDFPGDRGIVLGTVRSGGTGFTRELPDLWISDAADVSIDEYGRYPIEDVLAWFEAAASAIRRHVSITPPDGLG